MYKNKYIEGYRSDLLVKSLEVGYVPSTRNRPSFHSNQTVGILSGLPNDFVGAFPIGAQLSITWVIHVTQGFAEDKVPDLQFTRLILLVVEAD